MLSNTCLVDALDQKVRTSWRFARPGKLEASFDHAAIEGHDGLGAYFAASFSSATRRARQIFGLKVKGREPSLRLAAERRVSGVPPTSATGAKQLARASDRLSPIN